MMLRGDAIDVPAAGSAMTPSRATGAITAGQDGAARAASPRDIP
jgi:hypothetical protein